MTRKPLSPEAIERLNKAMQKAIDRMLDKSEQAESTAGILAELAKEPREA